MAEAFGLLVMMLGIILGVVQTIFTIMIYVHLTKRTHR